MSAWIKTAVQPRLTFPTLTGSIVTFNSQYAGLPLKSHVVDVDYTGSAISGVNVGCDNKYAGFINFNQLLPTAYKDFTNTVTDTRNFYLVFRKSIGPYTSLIATSITNTGLFQTIISASFDGNARFLHSGSQNNITITPSNAISVINGHIYFVSMLMEGIDTSAVGGLVTNDIFVIDLTALFERNPSMADEIYNMEQQTAGSGVAYFRSLFPNDYYDYNAGTLTTVSAVNGVSNSFFPITFDTPIYGGQYDCLTGIVTSNKDSGGGDITPTYQQTATANCETNLGENNIWADTGDTTLQYPKFG